MGLAQQQHPDNYMQPLIQARILNNPRLAPAQLEECASVLVRVCLEVHALCVTSENDPVQLDLLSPPAFSHCLTRSALNQAGLSSSSQVLAAALLLKSGLYFTAIRAIRASAPHLLAVLLQELGPVVDARANSRKLHQQQLAAAAAREGKPVVQDSGAEHTAPGLFGWQVGCETFDTLMPGSSGSCCKLQCLSPEDPHFLRALVSLLMTDTRTITLLGHKQEADKQLFLTFFNDLPLVTSYWDVREQLLLHGDLGAASLARVERDLLSKVGMSFQCTELPLCLH